MQLEQKNNRESIIFSKLAFWKLAVHLSKGLTSFNIMSYIPAFLADICYLDGDR